MVTFREIAWNVSPARLRTAKAARIVYALVGLPLDILSEGAEQAGYTGFPDYCPADALIPMGRDRVIVRGPSEPEQGYRTRLRLWLDTWAEAGVGRAMLDQIAAYLTPNIPRLRVWTQAGIIYTREIDGTFVVERVPSSLWNWDGNASAWARFWVIIYSIGGVPWTRVPPWGAVAGTWNSRPGLTWGSSATVGDARSIRSIIDEFKPGLTKCENVIVSFDASAFSPTDTSPPLPNGTWGEYWHSPSQTANRDRRALYWKGV